MVWMTAHWKISLNLIWSNFCFRPWEAVVGFALSLCLNILCLLLVEVESKTLIGKSDLTACNKELGI